MSRAYCPIWLTLIACIFVACSTDDEPGVGPTTKRVDASGGTVSSPDGVSVAIPAGALSLETEIGIELVAGRTLNALPASRSRVGPFVELTPHGTMFSSPVTVVLPHTANVSGLEVWVIDDRSDDTWERVDAATFNDETATVMLNHFSILTVTAPATTACGPTLNVAGQWRLDWDCDETCNDGSSRTHEGTVYFDLVQDGSSVTRSDFLFNGNPIVKVWFGTICGYELPLFHERLPTMDLPGLTQSSRITFNSGVDRFQSSGAYQSGIGRTRTCTATCISNGVKLCAENERVDSASCVPCPAGTTNAAGDDPSAADTMCDAAPEVITTISVVLTPVTGGPALKGSFVDIDGPGGADLVITNPGPLAIDTEYTMALEILNETESPAADITEEIREAAEEYQVFFVASGGVISVDYADVESDYTMNVEGADLPVGLVSSVTANMRGIGSLEIVLKHLPSINGVVQKDGSNTINDGETYFAVMFDITVQ